MKKKSLPADFFRKKTGPGTRAKKQVGTLFSQAGGVLFCAAFFLWPAAASAAEAPAGGYAPIAWPFYLGGALLFVLAVLGVLAVFWGQRHRKMAAQCQEQAKEGERLRRMDSLTGLYNRVSFIEEADAWLTGLYQTDKIGAIFYIDLGNFTLINNSFGARTADLILKSCGMTMKRFAGKEGFAGRINGDDFALCLPENTGIAQITQVAEGLASTLSKPIFVNNNSIVLNCHIGVLLVNEAFTARFLHTEDLLARGRLALINQKRLQNSQAYHLFNADVLAECEKEIRMQIDLHNIIVNNEFEMYYQPVYSTKENRIVALEALARWNSPVYGMVPPGLFIKMSEQSGFIVTLGHAIIENVLAFAQTMPADLRISFNCSSMEILQNDFDEHLISRIRAYGVAPTALAVEITESVLIEAFDYVSAKLLRLQGQGIQVYLDDFGSGYSSFAYLKKLPVNVLKIDRSFMENLEEGSFDRAIVESITQLAGRLQFGVIAEGVETRRQMDILKESGCPRIQGYYIGRPIPQADVSEFLESFKLPI